MNENSRPRLVAIVGLAIVGVGLSAISVAWATLAQHLGYPVPPSLARILGRFQAGSALGIAQLVVLAPIVEEVLFRGVILRVLLWFYPATVGVVVSTAVFAVTHPNVYQFVPAALYGVVVGVLFVRTGSVMLCVWLHAAYNAALGVNPDVMSLLWRLPVLLLGVWMLRRGLFDVFPIARWRKTGVSMIDGA